VNCRSLGCPGMTCLRQVKREMTIHSTLKEMLGWPIQAFFWLEWDCCRPHPLFVIRRACDFFDLHLFLHTTQPFFNAQTTCHPCSEAPRGSVAQQMVESAKSKSLSRAQPREPRRCLLADAAWSFPAANQKENLKSHNLRAQPRYLQFHSTSVRCRGEHSPPLCHPDRSEARDQFCRKDRYLLKNLRCKINLSSRPKRVARSGGTCC